MECVCVSVKLSEIGYYSSNDVILKTKWYRVREINHGEKNEDGSVVGFKKVIVSSIKLKLFFSSLL